MNSRELNYNFNQAQSQQRVVRYQVLIVVCLNLGFSRSFIGWLLRAVKQTIAVNCMFYPLLHYYRYSFSSVLSVESNAVQFTMCMKLIMLGRIHEMLFCTIAHGSFSWDHWLSWVYRENLFRCAHQTYRSMCNRCFFKDVQSHHKSILQWRNCIIDRSISPDLQGVRIQ